VAQHYNLFVVIAKPTSRQSRSLESFSSFPGV